MRISDSSKYSLNIFSLWWEKADLVAWIHSVRHELFKMAYSQKIITKIEGGCRQEAVSLRICQACTITPGEIWGRLISIVLIMRSHDDRKKKITRMMRQEDAYERCKARFVEISTVLDGFPKLFRPVQSLQYRTNHLFPIHQFSRCFQTIGFVF